MKINKRPSLTPEQRIAAGARAREKRLKLKLSQEKLGKIANLDQSSISDFENGKTRDASDVFMRRLSAGLQMSSEEILFGETHAQMLDERARLIEEIVDRLSRHGMPVLQTINELLQRFEDEGLPPMPSGKPERRPRGPRPPKPH